MKSDFPFFIYEYKLIHQKHTMNFLGTYGLTYYHVESDTMWDSKINENKVSFICDFASIADQW